jgi:hypothetical protein
MPITAEHFEVDKAAELLEALRSIDGYRIRIRNAHDDRDILLPDVAVKEKLDRLALAWRE